MNKPVVPQTAQPSFLSVVHGGASRRYVMMMAFHGLESTKQASLHRVRVHRAVVELIHGQYWEFGKGRAVGCAVYGDSHAAYESELGIPRILARLEDSIFEGLRSPEDAAWPEQFLQAIPAGADLSMVWPQFSVLLLSDAEHGVLRYVQHKRNAKQKKSIEHVVDFYRGWCKTGIKPAPASSAAAYAAIASSYDDAAAAAAASAADAASTATSAADAAYAAASAAVAATTSAAAAAYAATSAADAASAAAYAADAASAAVAYDAINQARIWQAAILLSLLRNA